MSSGPFLVAYQGLTGRGCWLFIFHARRVSFRYTSHMTTMFTHQTPTRHVLLAAQKRAFYRWAEFGWNPCGVVLAVTLFYRRYRR